MSRASGGRGLVVFMHVAIVAHVPGGRGRGRRGSPGGKGRAGLAGADRGQAKKEKKLPGCQALETAWLFAGPLPWPHKGSLNSLEVFFHKNIEKQCIILTSERLLIHCVCRRKGSACRATVKLLL